jgi:hypothetical protein
MEFQIEKVLGRKTIKNVPYVHVKYLYYPGKNNKFILIENL